VTLSVPLSCPVSKPASSLLPRVLRTITPIVAALTRGRSRPQDVVEEHRTDTRFTRLHARAYFCFTTNLGHNK
jgi:hypothetical protein